MSSDEVYLHEKSAQNGLDCRRSRQDSSRYGLHADHAGAGIDQARRPTSKEKPRRSRRRTAFSPQTCARIASDRRRWWRTECGSRFSAAPALLTQLREFPSIVGSAEIIPGSGDKNPGSPGTGICPQAIDLAGRFCRRSAMARAPGAKFPVIFPWRREFGMAGGHGLAVDQIGWALYSETVDRPILALASLICRL